MSRAGGQLWLMAGLAMLAVAPVPAATPAVPVISNTTPACPANAGPMDGWNDRAPPRKLFGNTYYVGTCGISAVLIMGKQGAILIDGATAQAPAAIEANLKALGAPLHSVKFLLNTHEHSDHAGGLAQLQRDTGAPMLARATAAATLRSGKPGHDDPQRGDLTGFPAVAKVRIIKDQQRITLGELAVTVQATPGHAPGGTSFTWQSCEGSQCMQFAYVDSHSALADKQYRYTQHPAYVAQFRRSLARVAALPCDILLTPHPGASDLFARLDGKAPLVDANACRQFADAALINLNARLAREASPPTP